MKSNAGFLVALFAAVFSAAIYLLVFDNLVRSESATSKERLSLYRATLQSSLNRLSHLPKTVALYPYVQKVLEGEGDVDGLNHYLEAINRAAQGAALYVMDASGVTVASSNFVSEESFVGANYGFRDYFKSAINNKEGRTFAVGATTGRPGFFISRPIVDGDKVIGVAVVKTEFEDLLSDWRKAGEKVLISDVDQVIILSSVEDFTYRSLSKIPQSRETILKRNRKFGNFEIVQQAFDSENGLFEGLVTIEGVEYDVVRAPISDLGWNIHYLAPTRPIKISAATISGLVTLIALIIALAILFFRSQTKQRHLEMEAKESAKIRLMNVKLRKEIEVRENAEKELLDVQGKLIQSSRLAALGKMSAAIVHEVNQPVTAINTFSSSGVLLAKSGKTDDVINVFSEIKNMTIRLGKITSDLLIFSRKPISLAGPIDLVDCAQRQISEQRFVIEKRQIKIKSQLPDHRIFVKGSQHRFEQLLSNLIVNALDACADSKGFIQISINQIDGFCHLIVEDNGVGIDQDANEFLFDPFFTTKEWGKGVGLGLAICYAIVDEAGGTIEAQNVKNGSGAMFTIMLPITNERSTGQPAKEALEHVK